MTAIFTDIINIHHTLLIATNLHLQNLMVMALVDLVMALVDLVKVDEELEVSSGCL